MCIRRNVLLTMPDVGFGWEVHSRTYLFLAHQPHQTHTYQSPHTHSVIVQFRLTSQLTKAIRSVYSKGRSPLHGGCCIELDADCFTSLPGPVYCPLSACSQHAPALGSPSLTAAAARRARFTTPPFAHPPADSSTLVLRPFSPQTYPSASASVCGMHYYSRRY